MKKGFCITCLECNEKLILKSDFVKNEDQSKITSTVMGTNPFRSLLFVCSNCGNEIEVEV